MLILALSLVAALAPSTAPAPERLTFHSPPAASGLSVHATWLSSFHLTRHIVTDGVAQKPADLRYERAHECSVEIRTAQDGLPTRVHLLFGEMRDHPTPLHDASSEAPAADDADDDNPLAGRIFDLTRADDTWRVVDGQGKNVNPSLAALVLEELTDRCGAVQAPGDDFAHWLSSVTLAKGDTRSVPESLARSLLGFDDEGKLALTITLAQISTWADGRGEARFALMAQAESAPKDGLECSTSLAGELRVDAATGRPLVLDLRGHERRLGAASDASSSVELVFEGDRRLAREWIWR